MIFLVVCAPVLAETPSLLKEAFKNWGQGKDDLSFVQRTRYLNDDGSLKEEQVERYDPSLPDAQRWALLEVNGKPPTDSERQRIQDRRNKKPRKKANKPLEEYFDLENAKVVETQKETVRYEVAVKPEAARLIAVEKLSVGIAVRKETKTIDRITAGLSEPMRIALGVAKVTDVDLDLHFENDDAEKKKSPEKSSEADGTARVVMSKLGNRAEYTWSEFRRVSRYQAGGKSSAVSDGPGETAIAAAPLEK
ncbi:MAG: hypothetical protein QM760_10995 [Nibricoccus sp.]